MESQENKYFVYALIDPVNNNPFYFGKGCGNRPYHHLDGRDKLNKAKMSIINILRILEHEPQIKYVEKNMSEKDAYDLETFCIKESRNFPAWFITNSIGIRKPPSRKGCTVSLKTRMKISNSTKGRKGKPLTEETKEK